MEIAGDSPSIESTSGFSICSRNCLAYADNDSRYRRCPSAKIVSKANDDFPEPETPVMTTNLFRGTTTSMFLRLCSRAPRMTMESIWVFQFIPSGAKDLRRSSELRDDQDVIASSRISRVAAGPRVHRSAGDESSLWAFSVYPERSEGSSVEQRITR